MRVRQFCEWLSSASFKSLRIDKQKACHVQYAGMWDRIGYSLLEEGSPIEVALSPAGLQELWSVLGHTGATRLLYMGVHENMCTPA